MPDNKKKILLVEDDRMIVDLYRLRFEEEGYEVYSTDKGSEAIAWAQENQPDVVLLDIILPEVDGFSILESLKSGLKTRTIPVIMLTNLAQEADRHRGEDLGADGYYVKSQHTPAEIFEAVKNYVN